MTRTIIQLYRGTTAQNDAFTGSAGELSFDTTTNEVRVHDGSTQGGHIISGEHPDLLDWKWADHELNDANWVRADTFSWQSGSVYKVAFNELFNDIYISTSWYASGHANVYTKSPAPAAGDTVYSDSACTTSVGTVTSYAELDNSIVYSGTTYTYNSNTYVTPASETVEGNTVSVYTGHSGRKITIPSYETAVSNIYTATGVAWYYIIDVPNKRFKLPRTKFGFTGLRDTVGNYVAPGLPNITGTFSESGANVSDATGAFSKTTSSSNGWGSTSGQNTATVTLDASASNSIYGNGTTVQPPATQMYLYFYVGNFTQTAIENTAGLNASLFNNKADLDFNNTGMIDYVVEKQDPTAGNNYTWYRKYKSGWVEQGGVVSGTGAYAKKTVNLPITMADTNYFSSATIRWGTESAWYTSATSAQGKAVTDIAGPIADITTVSFSIQAFSIHVWEVKGMAA